MENFLVAPGSNAGDETWQRHKSPLYWFDADWLQACMALMGVCAYELFDRLRHARKRRIDHPLMLVPFAGVGAATGYAVQAMLRSSRLEDLVRHVFVVRLGDLTYTNPETGEKFAPDQLLTNWPQFMSEYPQHLGWGFGLLAGTLCPLPRGQLAQCAGTDAWFRFWVGSGDCHGHAIATKTC